MRNRVQLNCIECRRRKIKCNRLEPCTSCINSNVLCVYNKKDLKTLEFNDQPEYVYRNHGTIYNMFNKRKMIENKLFNLTYVLERMVDFCHLDPKLSYIKSILGSEELEKALGKKLKRNELNMIKKVNLENYNVDPEIHNIIEFLVGMAFQFFIFNPVTVQTIQQSYLIYGLNSYLINCIAALMLPKYLLLRGVLDPLPLNENIFYIKALYLLSNPSTSKTEIALGAIYLFCFETNYGSFWGAFVHFGMAKATCLELRLHMVDADNNIYCNNSQNIELCEKRNAWWGIMGIEIILYLVYNIPINVQSSPEQCHIPHHLLNFSPGPFSIDENIKHSFQKIYSPSIYETLPHFNYISINAYFVEVSMLILREMRVFYNSPKGIDYRAKLLRNLNEKYEELVIKNFKNFFLLDYETKLKTNPSAYANSSVLFIIVTFSAFSMFYYEAISIAYIDIKCSRLAKKCKLKMKEKAKSLFNFIIKTMKLRNYPDPVIDLTQYYISSQVIPDIFVALIKLFTPIRTTEDMDQVRFILELLSELSVYFPKSQLYSDWCTKQMKTNGRFNYTNDIITISQKGILKMLEKSLNKQFFC